jgi:hypothetical protein
MADPEEIWNLVTLDLAAKIENDDYFSEIAVKHYRKGITVDEISRSLGPLAQKAGKSGACVIVLAPVLNERPTNAIAPIFDPEFTIRVLENPLINDGPVGTRKTAIAICIRLVELLKVSSADGLYSCLVPKETPIIPVNDPVAPVAYDVRFSGKVLTTALARVAKPACSPASGAVPQTLTLACATASAAIYYTTDGSYPGPANEDATLYTTSFSLTKAATLRIGAEKTGMLLSDTASYTFS